MIDHSKEIKSDKDQTLEKVLMEKIELLDHQEKFLLNKLHKLFNKKEEHLKLWVFIQILLIKIFINCSPLKEHYKNVLLNRIISEEVLLQLLLNIIMQHQQKAPLPISIHIKL